MNNQTFRYEVILDQSICGKQLKKYQECVDQAKNAKSKEKCGKKYKKYQFCLANAESDRLRFVPIIVSILSPPSDNFYQNLKIKIFGQIF